MSRRTTILVGLVCALGLLVSLGVAWLPGDRRQPPPDGPNIVYIMADDLSTNIVPYMSEVQAMMDEGVTFSNFIVTNSKCCPSRAAFLTGKYPHNNFVENNKWPEGGVGRFFEHDRDESIGVYLDEAGYHTGLLGKYLNEYLPEGYDDGSRGQPDYPEAYVAPGWDEAWMVGDGYQQFRYTLTDGNPDRSTVQAFSGAAEGNYLTDQLATEAEDFIDRNAAEPFFLTLTPFAVHAGGPPDPESPTIKFPPAPRDRPDSPDRPALWGEPEFPDGGDCGGDSTGGCAEVGYAPTDLIMNTLVENPPWWAPTEPLTEEQIVEAERDFVDRVRMAQSLDDLILRVREALVTAGVDDETYVVFGSDNGFHLGEHGLQFGKNTPYDHDARVPFVVVPPGGTTPREVPEIVSNVDLLPTFAEIAGVSTFAEPIDGHSFLGLLDGDDPAEPWRQTALIQYRFGAGDQSGDPDAALGADARVPTFHSLRTATYLYTDYGDLDETAPAIGDGEYFDLGTDPDQSVNVYQDLTSTQRSALNAALLDYADCVGTSCWDNGLVVP